MSDRPRDPMLCPGCYCEHCREECVKAERDRILSEVEKIQSWSRRFPDGSVWIQPSDLAKVIYRLRGGP